MKFPQSLPIRIALCITGIILLGAGVLWNVGALYFFSALALVIGHSKFWVKQTRKDGFLPRRELFQLEKPLRGAYLVVFGHMSDVEAHLVKYGPDTMYGYHRSVEKILLQVLADERNVGLYAYGDFDFVLVRKLEHTAPGILEKEAKVLDDLLQSLQQTLIPHPFDQLATLPLVIHLGLTATDQAPTLALAIEYARYTASTVGDIHQSSVAFFNKKDYEALQLKLQKFAAVTHTIEHNEIYPVFMPVIDCVTGELYGYEGLSRLSKSSMPIYEVMSLAEEMDVYVNLEVAMTYNCIDSYRNRPSTVSDARLFLNFTPETIRQKTYNDDIEMGLFEGNKYVIEIIERGEILPELIAILGKTVAKINGLVALDDFGTGFSNHLALLNAKPDIIKVARELLIGIDTDPDKQHVYANIVVFARNIGTKVLAEGIETEAEFLTLLNLGMDYAQGYFIGRPLPTLEPANPRSIEMIQEYQAKYAS